MEQHSPNIYGSIQLAGDAGTTGQILISQGIGNQVIWSTQLVPLYAATDKVAQLSLIGASDITWNVPAADAINGITFNGSTLWTLPANRTYLIQAYIKPTLATLAYTLTIVDTANNPVGSLNQPISGLASLAHEHCTAWFRPLVNTQIKLRLSGGLGVTIGATSHLIIRTQD